MLSINKSECIFHYSFTLFIETENYKSENVCGFSHRMAPKKKRKAPAKKAPAKRPPPSNLASLDEDDTKTEVLKNLLARLAALEKNLGLECRGESGTSSGQPMVKLVGPAETLETAPQVRILESTSSSMEEVPTGNNNTNILPWGPSNSQASAAHKSIASVLQPQESCSQQASQQDLGTITGVQTLPDRRGPYNQYWGTADWPQKGGCREHAIELGSHLTQKTIDKILRAEYIDIFSLMFREPDESDDEEEEEIKRKIDKNWGNWFTCFLIYAGVITKAYPARAHSLIEYLNIIYKARVNFRGNAWLLYDERFRTEAAQDHTLRWDLIEAQLWLQIMVSPRKTQGEKADSGHTILNFEEEQRLWQMPSHQPQKKAVCWLYASQGVCNREVCRFQHFR
nr:PREDICTED: uncharacterized protein LOC100554042 isoform X1 [Anolis carolinensis]|eukprot:XP_008110365.1 PREDICTED: uncharacterized protein LOC100554042 isoform X1 [Anolis carolinensis]